MVTNYKAPPLLKEHANYELWKKEIKLWKTFTDLDAKKQGPAICLSLTGKAREAALELSVENLNSDTGVVQLLAKLDELYLKDKDQLAYAAYDSFENFKRAPDMSIKDYLITFERLHHKILQYNIKLPEPVLAYRVLKTANISPEKEQLARATITELKYEAMKKQILKIFDETCLTKSSSPPVEVKVEDAFYSNSFRGRRFYHGRGCGGCGKAPGRRYANQSVQQNKGEQPQNKSVKVKNPLDANGFVTKCMVCRSIYHWVKDCPDRNAMYTACQEEEVHITLFSRTVQECYAENFSGETLSYAILDSGCTKSVCSRVWLQCYLDALNESDKSSVQEQESSSKFKFGDGALQTSLKKVIIPADINGTKVKIETDVIDNNLPLLLSKSAMQKAATKIDFNNNKVTMFGKVQDLHFTTSGHYCIPLDHKHKIINYEDQNATKVMFTNKALDNKTS